MPWSMFMTAERKPDFAAATAAGPNHARNPGIPLDPAMFEGHGVNRSAAERRKATLTTRRSVKKAYQAAWLVNAIR